MADPSPPCRATLGLRAAGVGNSPPIFSAHFPLLNANELSSKLTYLFITYIIYLMENPSWLSSAHDSYLWNDRGMRNIYQKELDGPLYECEMRRNRSGEWERCPETERRSEAGLLRNSIYPRFRFVDGSYFVVS